MNKAADFMVALFSGIPGWAVFSIGLVFYPVIGLVLPVIAGLSVTQLVVFNIVGVYLAGIVLLAWLTGQVEDARRRHLVDWTTDLHLLSSEEFEWLVGETFRREGWTVRETGRQDQPDGNIDLELEGHGKRVIVQCKQWRSQLVDVSEIRNFGGTLLREGLPGANGIYVTLSDFNQFAYREAHQIGIQLINGKELHHRMEKARKPQACPICGRPMVLNRSARGWWFRCVAPGCLGKLDLGHEPGRAVQLLTL